MIGAWTCIALIVAGISDNPDHPADATFWTGLGMGVLTVAARNLRRCPRAGTVAATGGRGPSEAVDDLTRPVHRRLIAHTGGRVPAAG